MQVQYLQELDTRCLGPGWGAPWLWAGPGALAVCARVLHWALCRDCLICGRAAPLLVHPFVAPHGLSSAAATGGCLELRAGCALAAGLRLRLPFYYRWRQSPDWQSPLGTPWEL